jgi:hypothetical protein
LGLLGASVLCLALFSGYALAQADPPAPESEDASGTTPQSTDRSEPPSEPKAEPAEKAEATPEAEPPESTGPTPQAEAPEATDVGPYTGAVERPVSERRAPKVMVKRSPPGQKKAGAKGKDQVKATGKTKGDDKSGTHKHSPRRGRGPTFEMDPDAKWVCAQTVAALDPVWRGDKQLTFRFDIRNEGTADLKIKAKGG